MLFPVLLRLHSPGKEAADPRFIGRDMLGDVNDVCMCVCATPP